MRDPRLKIGALMRRLTGAPEPVTIHVIERSPAPRGLDFERATDWITGPTGSFGGPGFKFLAGYATSPALRVVVIEGMTVSQGNQPAIWRRFIAPYESAVEELMDMLCDMEDFFEDHVRSHPYPVEDFDFDNLVQHLDMRINHAFH